MEFLQKLKQEAYTNVDMRGHSPNFYGLIRPELASTVEQLLTQHLHKEELFIVEIGSYVGYSALEIAKVCKKLNKKFQILCIDTWLGSPEFYTQSHWLFLNKKNGYPTIFFQFVKNVKYFNMEDSIVPLPLTSVSAAHLLRHYNLKPDLIYVDAAHEYESVKMDLESYYPLISDNGIILGDDFCWDGVKRAALDFTQQNHLSIHNVGEALWWCKKIVPHI